MQKAPEEGQIWEWRAFGNLSDKLVAAVENHPLRMGIRDRIEDDVYLIAALNDQNVKLRRYEGGWVLKVKLLEESRPGGFELYCESADYTYRFPVPIRCVEQAGRLLQSSLPQITSSEVLDNEQFVAALAAAKPPVRAVRVLKRRSQFELGDCWAEIASAECVGLTTATISIHSTKLEAVRRAVASLPVAGLEVMNYVEACRRWSSKQPV